MLLAEVLNNRYRSVAVIGMGKNTGKTFTFNQLIMEGLEYKLNMALTTIGLDGEERDAVFNHKKPRVLLSPGMIVANAKSLLMKSGLDYEILSTTDCITPLGEVVLARVLSYGETTLAGPSTSGGLTSIKEQLEQFDVELLLVDGAADRRSFSAPLLTDTAILAVGAEVAWERALLLEKLRHFWQILTLPAYQDPAMAEFLRGVPEDIKVVLMSEIGPIFISQDDFQYNYTSATFDVKENIELIYVQGLLSDGVLGRLWPLLGSQAPIIVARDPTNFFLGPTSLGRLAAQRIELKVLDAIQLSAVTVNPFHSSHGYCDPTRLLRDVGQTVYPIPCFDLALQTRYLPEKEDMDAIS